MAQIADVRRQIERFLAGAPLRSLAVWVATAGEELREETNPNSLVLEAVRGTELLLAEHTSGYRSRGELQDAFVELLERLPAIETTWAVSASIQQTSGAAHTEFATAAA